MTRLLGCDPDLQTKADWTAVSAAGSGESINSFVSQGRDFAIAAFWKPLEEVFAKPND